MPSPRFISSRPLADSSRFDVGPRMPLAVVKAESGVATARWEAIPRYSVLVGKSGPSHPSNGWLPPAWFVTPNTNVHRSNKVECRALMTFCFSCPLFPPSFGFFSRPFSWSDRPFESSFKFSPIYLLHAQWIAKNISMDDLKKNDWRTTRYSRY